MQRAIRKLFGAASLLGFAWAAQRAVHAESCEALGTFCYEESNGACYAVVTGPCYGGVCTITCLGCGWSTGCTP